MPSRSSHSSHRAPEHGRADRHRGRSAVRQLALATALIVALAACERPFIEPARPDLEIVSPDLSTVFPNVKLQIEVRASGQRPIDRIAINGDSLTYDPQDQLWLFDYALHSGLNRLVLEATDVDGRTTYDTVYAVHGTYNVDRNSPQLPEPRGGHSATLLEGGRLLILGGTYDVSADAYATGLIWNVAQNRFEPVSGSMVAARTGHTASTLPDGRVLILGGSRKEPLESVQDLIETVELFDPATESFRPISVTGDPIRRAYHTASVHQSGDDVFVDLYGGRGDVRYRPDPALGTRRDLRRFVFRNDTLRAVGPAPGPSLDHALWGHSQSPLAAAGNARRYLVTGLRESNGAAETTSFLLDYGSPSGIEQRSTGEPNHPRIRHAAAPVNDGFVVIFGGYGDSASNPTNDVEVYAEDAGRFFIFPPSNVLLRRFGLSATNLPDGRILLVGGYFSAGQGSVTTSVVQLSFL